MPEILAAGRAGHDRLRRIERPAGAGRSAGGKEACHEHQHRKQINPVAQHVGVGEHHVAGPDHQRDQVVAEAAEKQRGQQIDHHDHAVHGDELVVGLGGDEIERAGKAELQAHQPGQHQRHHADRDGGSRILDGDDLGILGEDVFRPPAVRMVEVHLRHFGWRNRADSAVRHVDHANTSLCASPTAADPLGRRSVPPVHSPPAAYPRQRAVYSAELVCSGVVSCANVCCSPSQAT